MIPALVMYLDGNGPGPGFFNLAQQWKLLPKNASDARKQEFFLKEVADVHEHYATRSSRRSKPQSP